MRFYQSLTLTFAMYSKIPMPMVEWDEKSMQWVFSCFPLVGVVEGAMLLLWMRLGMMLHLSQSLWAAIGVVLPLLLTGGIHLDGLCDVCDALGSNQPRERKLEIMKDPHIGAFGVMGCVVYLLMLYGCWCSVRMSTENGLLVAALPVLSRSWVSLAAVTRKNARGSGMLAVFTDAALGRWNLVCAVLWLAAAMAFCLWRGGAGWWMVGASVLVSAWFYRMSEKEFGGITGDLAGYYLQLLELGMLLAVTLTGVV